MTVVLEENGSESTIVEGATRLDVVGDLIRVSSFFEEPVEVADARVSSVDFLGGRLVLEKKTV
ncbi:MAG: CooT family nickel-binding protein [Desulfobulbaceae bacterium]|uniref:CooT family nickel-binding protein n=1 Tax=Candidatus Desulfatifera sulfidica TaxID=2841691 RepID=A0A8J6T9U1_9BACT|nr:CooT family nickel-binding protein [Candidatus Desulfatifera sulfidica]